jgi:hypothetical protein
MGANFQFNAPLNSEAITAAAFCAALSAFDPKRTLLVS